jgi:hypothetical protein
MPTPCFCKRVRNNLNYASRRSGRLWGLPLQCVAQHWDKAHVNRDYEYGRDQQPDDHGVPGGSPQKPDCLPYAGANQGLKLGRRNRQVRRPKQFFPEPEKWNQKRDLGGIHEIVHDLDGGKIQPKHQRRNRAKRRRPTDAGKNTKSRAERDGQGEFFRCHPLPQQIQDWPGDSAVEKSFLHCELCPQSARGRRIKCKNSSFSNTSRIFNSGAYLCRMSTGARVRSRGNTCSCHLTGTDVGT